MAHSEAPWTSSHEDTRSRREDRARRSRAALRLCPPGSQFPPWRPQPPGLRRGAAAAGGVPGRAPAVSLPSPTELGGFSTLRSCESREAENSD